jgi:uncharacterized protein (DUF924 family)
MSDPAEEAALRDARDRYHHLEPCDACAMFRQRFERAEARADALAAELATVDEALARRSALDDAPDRYTKIFRACKRAGEADALAADLAREKERTERLVAMSESGEELARIYDGWAESMARADNAEVERDVLAAEVERLRGSAEKTHEL